MNKGNLILMLIDWSTSLKRSKRSFFSSTQMHIPFIPVISYKINYSFEQIAILEITLTFSKHNKEKEKISWYLPDYTFIICNFLTLVFIYFHFCTSALILTYLYRGFYYSRHMLPTILSMG